MVGEDRAAVGEPVAVLAYFSAEGRCQPRVVRYQGADLQVDDILAARPEGARFVWVLHTTSGVVCELSLDRASLRWTVLRAQAIA